MPGGEIQLVAYGEENVFLNDNPQITFFKIVYKRYTNFSIETVKCNFVEQLSFGSKYTVEIPKTGDLMHKLWLVIDLPSVPIIYNLQNTVDKRLKFAWARKVAYALINYIDIDIGGQVIDRQWGEWMNILNELNTTNFNSSLNEYIGNTPEFYEYKNTSSGIPSLRLHVPLQFWFFKNSGFALPLLALEYSSVRLTIQLNEFSNCAIFSPSNYIYISNYYGCGIPQEPLLQIDGSGSYAWAEYDSIEIIDITDKNKLYKLYYRQISNNTFITTKQQYFNTYIKKVIELFRNNTEYSIDNTNNLDLLPKFFIYGLKSKSIFTPITKTGTNNVTGSYIYKYISNISIKNMFLLIDYIYLDREERIQFYNNKHEYIIEQIYFTGNNILKNLSNKNSLEIINPCKLIVFMGQLEYLTNPNVNDFFNYNTTFIRNDLQQIQGIPIIKSANFDFNSNQFSTPMDYSFYSKLLPFISYPMAINNDNYGIYKFCLYPINTQPSGSCNMSCFTNVDINTRFNKIDAPRMPLANNNYIFKAYAITYNILKIVHGVSGLVFNSNY